MNAFLGRTALVVDDEYEIAEIVGEFLETQGFRTIITNSSEEALQIVRSQILDVVISDVRMAEMDGITLLEEIRKIQSPVPAFIFMTGYSVLTYEDALQQGAVGILSKPVDFDRLINLLEVSILHKPREAIRRSQRFPCEIIGEVILNQTPKATPIELKNISYGGFLATSDPKGGIDIGAHGPFRLNTEVPEEPIDGRIVVRWKAPASLPNISSGVAFGAEFSKADHRRIHQIISKILS